MARNIPLSRGIAAFGASGWLRLGAVASGGYATYLGFAPSTWWWAPIVGIALLGLAVYEQTWRVAAGLGVVFGAAMFLPLLTWSGVYVGNLPWLALSLAEAALVAPATALIAVASRVASSAASRADRGPYAAKGWPIVAASLWVGGETLRAVFPFGGFPWGGIAFTQPDGPLLPIVTTLGEAGLAFAVSLAGFAAAAVVRGACVAACQRAGSDDAALASAPSLHANDASSRTAPTIFIRLALPVTLLLVPFLGGLAAALFTPVGTSITDVYSAAELSGRGASQVDDAGGSQGRVVAVIQGNVPEPGLEFNARRRAVLDMHAAETARLADAVAAGFVPQPAAVIWPENSSDIDPYTNKDAAGVIDSAARRIGAPILVGAVVAGPYPATVYNMGIVWDPVAGPGATYTKRHPVPFGEYMPWRDFFRLFSAKVDLVRADFLPGSDPGNLDVGGIPMGDVICFEVVEDGLVRDVVRGGAQVIVVQTNNATFGYTNETYQQQAMSRVRAIEYQRPVLIAATSGVSAIIDTDGSVRASVGLFTSGWLTVNVPDTAPWTPSTVLGAPVQWALTLLGLLAVAGGLSGIRRQVRSGEPSPGLSGQTPLSPGEQHDEI